MAKKKKSQQASHVEPAAGSIHGQATGSSIIPRQTRSAVASAQNPEAMILEDASPEPVLPLHTPTQSGANLSAPAVGPATHTDSQASQQSTSLPEQSTARALWCLILGDSIPFKVSCHTSTDINDLKKLIRQEGIEASLPVLAKDLVLWKVQPSELIVVKPSHALADRVRSHGEDLSAFATQLEPVDTVSEVFPVQPEQNRLHIIVQVPSPATGKRKREPPRDISSELFQRWAKPMAPLPLLQNLTEYFNGPLANEDKIPLSQSKFDRLVSASQFVEDIKARCHASDFEQLFRLSEDEEADLIMMVVYPALGMGPPEERSTESSFHSFWDRNIRVVFDAIVRCKTIRDSNEQTSTGLLRPDFGVLVGNVCVFRGEEKSPTFSGKHPRDELIDKLTWTYDPAHYVLGYHAIGTQVTLAAISKDSVQDLSSADLLWKTERLKNLIRMIKLCPIITALQNIIGPRNTTELEAITREATGTVIKIGASAVEKKYTRDGATRVNHLRNIYQLLHDKSVPNVDSILQSHIGGGEHEAVVLLRPRGMDVFPRNAQEIIEAIICVLEALAIMHADPTPIFHRDIRWPNVIRSASNPKKWFLIDWDDASTAPTQAAMHLHRESHCPSVFLDGHGAEVDIWGAGKLMADAGTLSSNVSHIIALGRRMMAAEISTAASALDELRHLQ